MYNKWSTEEKILVEECIQLGSTYMEIAEFIHEDFGILRTTNSIKKKCLKLGFNSLNNKKDTKQFIKELNLINTDICVLGKYVTNKEPIKVKCLLDNNIWYPIPSNLLRGQGCPVCALKSKTKTHEQYTQELPYGIISLDKYINASTKILHKCIVCSHEWRVKPYSILDGHGCPKCNKKGGYQQLTKERANSITYPIYLYHIKLQYKDEVFYKYGLTSRKDRRRYNEYGVYKVIEEISFEEYDAWTAICKEKECISNYTPKYKFNGRTECYV